MPKDRFDTLFNGRKRPDWAGAVEIDVEEMLHVRHGAVRRTKLVKGIVVPIATAGRQAAPETLAPFRIGQSGVKSDDLAISAYNTGAVDLDKGHVMALELGGPDVPSNIVPQWSQWQRNGEWRKMEKEIEKKASALLKEKLYLLYHAIVHYKQYENPALATFRGFSIPTGFEIHLSTLRPLGTGGWMIVASEKFRELEQSQDQTDDMIALRKMMELERRADPSFDPTEVYPDLALKNGKLVFGPDGQSPIYRPDRLPPPVSYSPPQGGPVPALTNNLALKARVADALPTGRITRSMARSAAAGN